MKISTFKSKTQSTPNRYAISPHDEFDNIRGGSIKKTILELRGEPDLKKQDQVKGTLPAVTFQGTFHKRAKDGLKEASGLMVLDYDKVKDVIEAKELLTTNDYIFACWISPSGNGIKALVKIPIVETDEQYKSYYSAIQRTFNESYEFQIDNSGKDISRLCFTSYDPDLYINESSLVWTEFDVLELERPIISHEIVTVPCTDEDEIVRRLMKWFESKYNPSARNNSINILAYSFNLFGVPKSVAESICLRYEQKDFRANEIIKTVQSAYSKSELFGTQTFQDNKKRDAIRSFSRGRSIEEVKKKFKEVSDEVIQQLSEDGKEIIFWTENDKGIIKIVPSYFRDYLHQLGFNKIFFNKETKVVTFIRREGNFVREYSNEEVKDFVLNDIEERGLMDVWNVLANSPKYFQDAYISMLQSKEVDVERDGKDYALFYFQNTVVKVTRNDIELIPYDKLQKPVWVNQVLNRDFSRADHHESDFRTFIWNVSGKNVDNYNVFKAVIGRLLHTFKTTSGDSIKAIIANDTNLSDDPNGGSGKSLLSLAISQLRKVAVINGKTFDFKDRFNYQTVPMDTQVLVYDDVEKNFNFENLFSVITNGLTLEYKGLTAVKLDVTQSPIIYINTNYAIKGNGGSHVRRKHEIEFSSHYNSAFTPEDEFGNRFFDDWDELEWSRFDSYMINCLQYYMANGLVKPQLQTLVEKKFRVETSNEWFKFCIDKRFKLDERYYKDALKEDFLTENDHYKELTNKTLKSWASAYASFKHWNIKHDRDHRGYYFEFYLNEPKPQEVDEFDNIPDELEF